VITNIAGTSGETLRVVVPAYDEAPNGLRVVRLAERSGLAGLGVVQRPVVHQARTAGLSKYDNVGRAAPVLTWGIAPPVYADRDSVLLRPED
jgi:hypothetical protein